MHRHGHHVHEPQQSYPASVCGQISLDLALHLPTPYSSFSGQQGKHQLGAPLADVSVAYEVSFPMHCYLLRPTRS